MNAQISWDSSLVKKFSSSNHFKLLNQLRTEVKKYPLNKKKNLTSNSIKDNKIEHQGIHNSSNIIDRSLSNNSEVKNNNINNQSHVSFNNSKNFSIYKNINDDLTQQLKSESSVVEKNSNEEGSSSTFKDRLNQIDMK